MHEIMWVIPLCQLNQIVHAHLCYNGAICRRSGTVDALDTRFEALCETFTKRPSVLTTGVVV